MTPSSIARRAYTKDSLPLARRFGLFAGLGAGEFAHVALGFGVNRGAQQRWE